MQRILKSKLTAWCAMILTIALIVLAFIAHTPWWGFIAIFFLFLSVFMHIMSLYLGKISFPIGKKLDICALICIVLAVIGFIVEYIFFNFC